MRGNYPRSRIYFERALELAQTAKSGELELLAHQGLTICLAIGKDFDRALQHAWATYELSQGDRRKETEALTNLAQLSLDSGFPRAALQGFAAVLHVDVLRKFHHLPVHFHKIRLYGSLAFIKDLLNII